MKTNGVPAQAATEHSASVNGNPKPAKWSERRRHARYPVCASVDVIEMVTRTRLKGRATDLSVGGCYVDVLTPFEESSTVRLRISSEGHSFIATAVVTFSLRGMGMGLMFVDVTPEQTAILRTWVAELNGTTASMPEQEIDDNITFVDMADPGASTSLRDGTLDLINVLLQKRILTEAEAKPLRKKISG